MTYAGQSCCMCSIKQARIMQEIDRAVKSFDELHDFVHQTLCESENLLAEQFQTRHNPLCSKERVCAIEYSLRGPRSLRLAAIWAAEQNTVYFYNARGERHLKVKITTRLSLQELEASSAA